MPVPSNKLPDPDQELQKRSKDDFFSVATASVKGPMMIDGYIAMNQDES